MRRMLATAVALGPLAFACGAQAETVISTERTTPVLTSTAASGAPDSVRVALGGTIRLTSGTAVTLNSSHAVSNEGQILLNDVSTDGTTGILVQGGNTASVTNSGVITITDNLTPTDTDSDGDPDGPFATGSGRFGIRVVGPGAFTGDITNTPAGNIRVEGNQSAAISVETGVVGSSCRIAS